MSARPTTSTARRREVHYVLFAHRPSTGEKYPMATRSRYVDARRAWGDKWRPRAGWYPFIERVSVG